MPSSSSGYHDLHSESIILIEGASLAHRKFNRQPPIGRLRTRILF